jgi:hypothetical protein
MAIESDTGADAGWGSEYRYGKMVLGALLCVPALVSVIQKVFQIGLAPPIQGAVELYHKLYHPLLHWAGSYFLFFFPYADLHQALFWPFMSRPVYQDLTLIAVLSSLPLLRAVLVARLAQREDQRLANLATTRRSLAADAKKLEAAARQLEETWKAVPLSEIDRRQRLEDEYYAAHAELRRAQQQLRIVDREELGGRALQITGEAGWEARIESYLLLALLALACGFTLIGLLLPLLATIVLHHDDDMVGRLNRQYLVGLGVTLAFTGAAFLLSQVMR